MSEQVCYIISMQINSPYTPYLFLDYYWAEDDTVPETEVLARYLEIYPDSGADHAVLASKTL